MARKKIKLTVAYDGFDYFGWQVQPDKPTVQQCLCEAASGLFERDVWVHGASRTDARVHALGQAALFEVDTPVPVERMARVLTGRLPADIAVLEAEEVGREFDLIAGPVSKMYRYTIRTCCCRPVLDMRYCWHLPGAELDLGAMRKAAAVLVGKHDFTSFASASDKRKNPVRTVFRCDVRAEGDRVFIETEGDGFLYNMVRNIVGTLVDVGRGRWNPEEMECILAAKNRTAAGQIAPAQGLCLMWVKY